MIATLIAATPAPRLAAVVAGYGDRLLLIPERELVVIKGFQCSDEAPGRIVKLAHEKVIAFDRLGIGQYSDHVAAEGVALAGAGAGS